MIMTLCNQKSLCKYLNRTYDISAAQSTWLVTKQCSSHAQNQDLSRALIEVMQLGRHSCVVWNGV